MRSRHYRTLPGRPFSAILADRITRSMWLIGSVQEVMRMPTLPGGRCLGPSLAGRRHQEPTVEWTMQGPHKPAPYPDFVQAGYLARSANTAAAASTSRPQRLVPRRRRATRPFWPPGLAGLCAQPRNAGRAISSDWAAGRQPGARFTCYSRSGPFQRLKRRKAFRRRPRRSVPSRFDHSCL